VQITASQVFQTLTVGAGAVVTLAPAGGNRVLVSSGFTSTGGGVLDLADDTMIFRSTAAARLADAAALTGKIKAGFNLTGTRWAGPGITTSLGGDGTSNHHALGVIVNDRALAGGGGSGPLYTTFGSETVGVNDVLVKYTLFGDADLTGTITSNDYFQIDTGFLAGKTGWINGDFDYNGVINSNDYFLIDSAFLAQSTQTPAISVGLGTVSYESLSAGAPIPLTLDDPKELLENLA
jgi:hypothetical protein